MSWTNRWGEVSTQHASAEIRADRRLAALPDSLILPGHGDPFTDGPRAAADQARQAGTQ